MKRIQAFAISVILVLAAFVVIAAPARATSFVTQVGTWHDSYTVPYPQNVNPINSFTIAVSTDPGNQTVVFSLGCFPTGGGNPGFMSFPHDDGSGSYTTLANRTYINMGGLDCNARADWTSNTLSASNVTISGNFGGDGQWYYMAGYVEELHNALTHTDVNYSSGTSGLQNYLQTTHAGEFVLSFAYSAGGCLNLDVFPTSNHQDRGGNHMTTLDLCNQGADSLSSYSVPTKTSWTYVTNGGGAVRAMQIGFGPFPPPPLPIPNDWINIAMIFSFIAILTIAVVLSMEFHNRRGKHGGR